ncbi:MAG: 4Fe-4S dicluster domain-containing protein [Deltaproteobacteria bacterium]|nr:4Fe-4S dicluster domain-containing protein [Deltaproteobacteria bacterium]
MTKKPFFNMGAKPRLMYPVLLRGEAAALREIPLSARATLFCPEGAMLSLKRGDRMRTGQRIDLGANEAQILISTVTGAVADVSVHKGPYGRSFQALSLDVDEEDEFDEELGKTLPLLNCLPGSPDFGTTARGDGSVHTWVVTAQDKDLLITTNQFLLHTRLDEVREGVKQLRGLPGTDRVVIVVPPELFALGEQTGAEVRTMQPVYPNAHHDLLLREMLGRDAASGGDGVGFLSVEAVIGLQTALCKGEPPVHKVLTVIDKDLNAVHVRVRIGTPVKNILDALGIKAGYGDRVVFGGPMTGEAIYGEDMPVLYDTDGLIVQDGDTIQPWCDASCVNCGECIRACPARIPVNMLVRFLENGLYQEAANAYDLLSCIECGLCSYVCEARIPVFQYIMLGKVEFARKMDAEVANAQ